jgi:streptogramin lyase
LGELALGFGVTKASPAIIERVYGPFTGVERVNGVTFDGQRVWFASGPALVAFDPDSGQTTRTLELPARAGTAFDGRFLYQVADSVIQKLVPETGEVLECIPLPTDGPASGLTWAEGSLWLGQYQNKRILKLDPKTGRVLHVVQSDRFVTGVTFDGAELWHGAMDGDQAELRHVDPKTSSVIDRLELPLGAAISGVEADGAGRFYCGGGGSAKVLAIRRPAHIPKSERR